MKSNGPTSADASGTAQEPSSTSPGLFALIREDYETHKPSAWSNPAFRAMAVYRFNRYRLGVKSRWLRLPLTVLALVTSHWIRNHYGIEIPPTAQLGRRVYIIHNGGIVIHRYAVIGDDCWILHGVTLGSAGPVTRDNAPKLGKGVRVGAGAMILGGITIGDGAKVGPNAVVMRDIPPGATAFAAPARLIYPPEEA